MTTRRRRTFSTWIADIKFLHALLNGHDLRIGRSETPEEAAALKQLGGRDLSKFFAVLARLRPAYSSVANENGNLA
jgi:hypothetical protein